jgi:glycogen synthase
VRVLHITTEYPPIVYGGLGTAVGGLVAASAHAGIRVAVLLIGHGNTPGYHSSAPEAPNNSDFTSWKIRNVTVWAIPHAAAVSESVEFARRWRPDVIHVHVFWLAHVAAAVRKATGVPLVYTVHSLDRAEYELGQGPPECVTQWPMQAGLINDADRIIALTQEERDLVGQYCPAARHRVRVVGNGIEDTVHARKHARMRQLRQCVTVLYTGRFVDRKGIKEILNAAPEFLRAGPHVRLVMAGGHRHANANDLADYWLPASCKPVRDQILFTGWLASEQLAEWYAEADILVVPSWYEPFGMVILEGMLYGLAIVAALVGGPKEILIGEHTCLFCKPKDVASLAAQVIRLIQDPALRSDLGTKAATDVRWRWLHEHVLGRMSSVYIEAASIRQSSTWNN